MRRLLPLVAVLIASGPVSAFAAEATTTRSYLVATRGQVSKAMIQAFDEQDSPAISFRAVDGFVAELTEDEVIALRKSPAVRYIERNPRRYAYSETPDQTQAIVSTQSVPYGIELVGSRGVWPYSSGASIKVGVVDTGIDSNHPELKNQFKGGYDFVQNDEVPQDGHGHGTHVAGTIAALDDLQGVVGIAPAVDLYGLRVLDDQGEGDSANLIRAVEWAIDNKLNVLNLSLGSPESSDLEEEAFKRASDAGILVVAASGNGYRTLMSDGLGYPAGYASVVAVGAIDSRLEIAAFSQRGAGLALVAPGVGILSSVPLNSGRTGDVRFPGGLVSATPLVGSPRGEVTETMVYSGFGRLQDFSSAVAGKIALIQRGKPDPAGPDITFNEKVKNAKAAGAIGVVIYNNVLGTINPTLIRGINCDANGLNCTDSPEDLAFPWPVTLFVSLADGEVLKAKTDPVTLSSRSIEYSFMAGTSMATPHVAGVAALIWSLAPNATAAQVREAMISSATDLGPVGFDTTFGHGMVNAYSAGKRLAAQKFPAVGKTRRR